MKTRVHDGTQSKQSVAERLFASHTAQIVLWCIAAAFYLLRFVHLSADYPRIIRWDDGILTDEGWYTSSAINLHTWGTWLLPGDMNIAVLMPVWPLLASAAFHLFGFRIEVLRGLVVVCSALCMVLLRLLLKRYSAAQWSALLVCLLAVNPWAFALSRAAFLEPPMLVFFLAGLLIAVWPSESGSTVPRMIVAGVLFTLAMLTKTTVLALAPAVLVATLFACGFRWKAALQNVLVISCTVVVLYGSYLLLYEQRYAVDAHYYLNVIPGGRARGLYGLVAQMTRPFRYGAGSDHLLFALSYVVLAASLLLPKMRQLWRDPLFALAGSWILSVTAFLILVNNVLPHYLDLMIPALGLMAVALLRNAATWPAGWSTAFVWLLLLDGSVNAVQVLAFLARPTFAMRDAARGVDDALLQAGAGNAIVVGVNAPEVALQSGFRPLNLFARAAPINRQVERYWPTWWLQYTPEDSGICFDRVLHQVYSAERYAAWPVNDFGREVILYRLTRLPGTVLPVVLSPQQKAACRSPWVPAEVDFSKYRHPGDPGGPTEAP